MDVVLKILAIVIALSFHECAHAFVSDLMGDPTARQQGRLTLNIVRHLDPIGALVLFISAASGGVIFGWGKPVPINPRYYRDERSGVLYTSLAGPLSNFLLAMLGGVLLRLVSGGLLPEMLASTYLLHFLELFVMVNAFLCVFNLIPISPLDGSKVLMALLPPEKAWAFQDFEMRFGMYLPLALFLIVLSPVGDLLILPLVRLIVHLAIG